MSKLTIDEMLERQSKLQKVMFGYELPNDLIEDFKYSVLGLIGELGEVLDADSRWKNVRIKGYDSNAKLDELVDCMAFLLNMILFSGYTSEEFANAFIAKNKKNFERVGSKYDSNC